MALRNKKDLWKGAIKGELYWPSLATHNEMSQQYQYDLCNLSEAAVQKLTELGVSVRNKEDDRGNFITCKSGYPFKVQDADGMAWNDDVLVGNGSKARAQGKVIEGDNSFGHWVIFETFKLQIDELVAYNPDEDVDLMEEAL